MFSVQEKLALDRVYVPQKLLNEGYCNINNASKSKRQHWTFRTQVVLNVTITQCCYINEGLCVVKARRCCVHC